MKSNYMISAEIKIAKNPNMHWWEKSWLKFEAGQKEIELERKLRLLKYKVYAPADQYATNNGFNASGYFIDELAAQYEPISAMTRETLQRLIDNVRATNTQEPVFIGTRDALDAMANNYRFLNTPIDLQREYTGIWEPNFNTTINTNIDFDF